MTIHAYADMSASPEDPRTVCGAAPQDPLRGAVYPDLAEEAALVSCAECLYLLDSSQAMT